MKKKQYFITAVILLMLAVVVSPVSAMIDLPVIFSEKPVAQDGLSVGIVRQAPNSPQAAGRALLVMKSYYTDPGAVQAGAEFVLHFELENRGDNNAVDVVVTFSSSNFSPMENGGVLTKARIKEGTETERGIATFKQKFYAAPGLWGSV
ncbi:MAG: hypothetical protein AAGU05_10120, partial [Anaerolineaceae bacterium]